jgi:hypothetical protein
MVVATQTCHAVLAKCGVQVSMTDLFGVAGIDLLTRVELPGVYRGRGFTGAGSTRCVG